MRRDCIPRALQWMRFAPIWVGGRGMAGKGGPREKCAPGVPPEKMCPKRHVWKGANLLKIGAG